VRYGVTLRRLGVKIGGVMKGRYIRVLLFVLVFALGMTVGELLDWGYFELVRQISVIEALTLIATVGCAIYITKVLEKRVQDVRMEKSLYIAEIEELSNLLHSIDVMFEEPHISFKRIEVRIYACIRRAEGIFRSMESSRSGVRVVEMELFDHLITDQLVQLKMLLTKASSESSAVPAVTMDSGVVRYSEDRINEINARTDMILGLLFRLKVLINHL
jgi:hypothetical protein